MARFLDLDLEYDYDIVTIGNDIIPLTIPCSILECSKFEGCIRIEGLKHCARFRENCVFDVAL